MIYTIFVLKSQIIPQYMANNRVILYGNNQCPYCVRAMNLMNEKGIPFEKIEVQFSPMGGLLKDDNYKEMVEKSNGGHTVPQIFIDGKHMGGSDDFVAWVNSEEFDESLISK